MRQLCLWCGPDLVCFEIVPALIIGEAFLYLSEGNRKRAQVVHDLIQLNRTSLAYVNYVRLFHGLLSLELFAAGGAPREAAMDRIAAGVEATGFTRFLDLARRGRAINGY